MERMLEIIRAETNMHRGITLPELASRAGMDVKNTRAEIIDLYRDKKIRTRNGINHILIYPVTWKK